jgi:hypothetical protein
LQLGLLVSFGAVCGVTVVKNACKLKRQHQPENHVFVVGQIYQVFTDKNQVTHLCWIVKKTVVVSTFAEVVRVSSAEAPLFTTWLGVVGAILGEDCDELKSKVVRHPSVDDWIRAVDRDKLHPVYKLTPVILILDSLVAEKFNMHYAQSN